MPKACRNTRSRCLSNNSPKLCPLPAIACSSKSRSRTGFSWFIPCTVRCRCLVPFYALALLAILWVPLGLSLPRYFRPNCKASARSHQAVRFSIPVLSDFGRHSPEKIMDSANRCKNYYSIRQSPVNRSLAGALTQCRGLRISSAAAFEKRQRRTILATMCCSRSLEFVPPSLVARHPSCTKVQAAQTRPRIYQSPEHESADLGFFSRQRCPGITSMWTMAFPLHPSSDQYRGEHSAHCAQGDCGHHLHVQDGVAHP